MNIKYKWPEVAIEDFAEVITGGTPSTRKPEYWDGGTIPWLNSGELNKKVITQAENFITEAGLKNSAAKMMPVNAVLVALTGATTGITALLKMRACANQSVTGILPSNKHNPNFLYHYLQFIRPKIIFDSYGGAQNHISQGYIKKLKIPLPPLKEQEQIANYLDEADELRKLRVQADQHTTALIPALFHKMFNKTIIDRNKWTVCTLCELIVDGPQNGLYKHSSYYGEGNPILRIDGFYDGIVGDLSLLKRLRVTPEEIKRYGLHENDIVINRVNSPEYLGKSALIPKLSEPTVFESNMMRFTVATNLIDPVYFICYLQTKVVKEHILSRAKHAINQSSINQEDVKCLRVPIPPLSLQKEFTNRVTEIRKLQEEQSASRQHLDDLFKSCLHRAFNGEL